jgi:hypothetical protein
MTARQRENQRADVFSLHAPFCIVKWGERKEMQLPKGAANPGRNDNTLVKALARAFRWKSLVVHGEYATFADLARHEDLSPSYVHRIVQLTLLSPDMVDAILDGRLGPDMTLGRVLEIPISEWTQHMSSSDSGSFLSVDHTPNSQSHFFEF